jgi:hypothetical protein
MLINYLIFKRCLRFRCHPSPRQRKWSSILYANLLLPKSVLIGGIEPYSRCIAPAERPSHSQKHIWRTVCGLRSSQIALARPWENSCVTKNRFQSSRPSLFRPRLLQTRGIRQQIVCTTSYQYHWHAPRSVLPFRQKRFLCFQGIS